INTFIYRMDDAFQQLDYSDLSAQNINKKPKQGVIDTKSKGGLIRLIIFASFIIIIVSCSISLVIQSIKLRRVSEIVKSKEEEKERRTGHLSNFTRKYSELKNKKIQYEKHIESLNQELKALKSDNSSLSEKNITAHNDLKKLELDYDNLSKIYQEQYTYAVELKNNISKVQIQNKYLEEKIEELSKS
ncbi:MAG: hypothetical protein MJ252_06535, partial [archaeon]|nr:hypothetical protein [archaeon]